VDYRYTPQGIRTISVDWTDANLDGTFAAGERTGSVEYLIENANFTGYQQTILETVKNAAGQATKRTTYTFGVDEITQTTTLPLPGGGEGWGEGETLTFAHDGKGSVRALFGAAAAIAQVFTYSAYGELLAIYNGSGTLQPLTSSLTSVLYNGEGLDARTGLYNMRARWYSASNARWERLDPFNGNPHDPFSFHKYGFVHGDPVQGIDPTGMFFSVSMAISAFNTAMTVGTVVGVGATTYKIATEGIEALTFWDYLNLLPFAGNIGRAASWAKYASSMRGVREFALASPQIVKLMTRFSDDLANVVGRARGWVSANIGTQVHNAFFASRAGRILTRVKELTANSTWVQIRLEEPIFEGVRGDGAKPDITILFPSVHFAIAVDLKPVPQAIFQQGYLRSLEYLYASQDHGIIGRREGTRKILEGRGFFPVYLYLPYPSVFR